MLCHLGDGTTARLCACHFINLSGRDWPGKGAELAVLTLVHRSDSHPHLDTIEKIDGGSSACIPIGFRPEAICQFFISHTHYRSLVFYIYHLIA